jgi:NADH dehydrogenase (ubiquinone) 1 beta subcomplex subunit 7
LNSGYENYENADGCGQNERHSYEKCQYEEFKERVKKMDELRAAKGGQRSN